MLVSLLLFSPVAGHSFCAMYSNRPLHDTAQSVDCSYCAPLRHCAGESMSIKGASELISAVIALLDAISVDHEDICNMYQITINTNKTLTNIYKTTIKY